MCCICCRASSHSYRPSSPTISQATRAVTVGLKPSCYDVTVRLALEEQHGRRCVYCLYCVCWSLLIKSTTVDQFLQTYPCMAAMCLRLRLCQCIWCDNPTAHFVACGCYKNTQAIGFIVQIRQ